ncbi:MAG: hypothetical protein LC770_10680 [Acidobacteria bacterium]|nr:hypothetical protein [Acidobacteriota bacterium]HYN25470.1 hypothetical protein [Pyrinomonadaceae bacterium]
MSEPRESVDNACNAVYDALRYLGDASYAILPANVAHELGDLKKKFLSNVSSLIEKDIEWIDARVAGGDRLREEWKRACNRDRSEQAESL